MKKDWIWLTCAVCLMRFHRIDPDVARLSGLCFDCQRTQ